MVAEDGGSSAVFSCADSSRLSYEGELDDEGRYCGYGVLTCAPADGSRATTRWNGWTYSGEWSRGLKHGLGEFTATNTPYCYTGMWSNDFMHGNGVEIGSDRTEYKGEWLRGLKHGNGVITHTNGDTYSGCWSHGKPDGNGVETLANGDEYSGEFRNGLYHGYGTLTTQRWTYCGEWVSIKQARTEQM